MNKIWVFVKDFFKKEVDSIRGVISLSELTKSLLTGILSGSGFMGILAALDKSLPTIVTDPAVLKTLEGLIYEAANKQWPLLIITVLGLALDAMRRLTQGDLIIIVPKPTPKTPEPIPVIVPIVPTDVKKN